MEEGGSYIRNKDGSLTLVHRTKPAEPGAPAIAVEPEEPVRYTKSKKTLKTESE